MGKHVFYDEGVAVDVFGKEKGIRVVSKIGPYTTVQSAIDASVAGDVIHIYPGTYDEIITIGIPLELKGMGGYAESVIITGLICNLTGSETLYLCKLTFTRTVTADGQMVIEHTGGRILGADIAVRCFAGDYYTDAIVLTNDALYSTTTTSLVYIHTGTSTGSNIHHLVKLYDTATFAASTVNFQLFAYVDDDDYCVCGIDPLSTARFNLITVSCFAGHFSPTFSGGFSFLCAENSFDTKTIQNALIELRGAGSGTGSIFNVTSGNPAIIESQNNNILVTGFTNNYFANLTSGSKLTSYYDNIDADDFQGGLGEVVFFNERKAVYSLYLSGVSGTAFIAGTNKSIATGQTGNYATDFSCGGYHAYIVVNAVTTGGDIVITGVKTDSYTGIPSVTTETITIDTTTGTYYQTLNYWQEITNIDITSGTITGLNYDIGVIGYVDGGDTNFRLNRYRVDLQSAQSSAAIRFILRSVKTDSVTKKMVISSMEDITISSPLNQRVDNLRTGGDDRSHTFSSTMWPTGNNYYFEALDFNTYFTDKRNVFYSANTDMDGFIVRVESVSKVDFIAVEIGTQPI